MAGHNAGGTESRWNASFRRLSVTSSAGVDHLTKGQADSLTSRSDATRGTRSTSRTPWEPGALETSL